MKIKNGALVLTQAEREGLRSCAIHARINKSWGEGGSVTKEKKGEFVYDVAESKSIDKGFEVIKFILEATK